MDTATSPTEPDAGDNRGLAALFDALESGRADREELYTWFHRHPEVAMEEHKTSTRIAQELEALGLEPLHIGGTGVVTVVENPENPDGGSVLVRADFDGLPVPEDSGKDYAADPERGRSHACGHDVHATALLGAVRALVEHPEAWHGRMVAVFQPGEERAAGARAMVEDGLAEKIPDVEVALAQHVLTTLPGGAVGAAAGPVLSTATTVTVTIPGAGSHGSMPHLAKDPVVTACAAVTRLQTIVSRELAPGTFAVVTVGSVQAGDSANVIPDHATLKLNTRAYDEDVAKHLHEAIERIVRAECAAAGMPGEPTFEYSDVYPLTDNDAQTAATVQEAFAAHLPTVEFDPATASEDFSVIPDALGVPYCYWGLGGFAEPEKAPANHNPGFAPDLQPTLDRGSQAILVAASPWLLS